MIISLIIGRGQSKGFPGKNAHIINGKELMAYPILAAKNCRLVDKVYFSTEDEKLKNIAKYWGAEIIDRPDYLATDEALAEHAFIHGYWYVDVKSKDNVEFAILMFANSPCINSAMIEKMILQLRKEKSADSICTISRCNAYSAYRLRVCNDKWVQSYLPQHKMRGNCDRNSAEDFWIYDCSCAVVRPHCLEFIEYGFLPQPWLGVTALHYKQQIPALDIDYKWQLGQIEYWLKENGK